MPNGRRLLAVPVRQDGLYDDAAVTVLPRSDPWERLARKLLRLDGLDVELAQGDEDRYLAELLLRHGVLTDVRIRRPVLRKQGDTVEWYCFHNAVTALQSAPGARLAVGLAHHEGWAWVAHTWGILPLGRILEATDVARWYYGLPDAAHGTKLDQVGDGTSPETI